MSNKSVSEIQTKISATIAQQEADGEKLKSLRQEWAQLTVESDSKDEKRIVCIDSEILKLRAAIDNSPAVIAELENQLAIENQRIAQTERDNLLEQQNLVASEIEKLSKKLVDLLTKANDVNIELRNALSAEAGLKNKTGVEVLQNYCDGSMQSLQMLLETCQAQMDGIHTFAAGAGIVSAGSPIRL